MTYTLLGIFAHPDDEGSCGGTLAKYAALGHRVYVACATRGDGVDAKISDPALAARETLGDVRSQELTCACAKLGLEPPLFLGYQDGDVDQVPVEDGGRAVARLIRAVKADIVISHGPEGGYGHPDHIAVSALTTRGFALAGDPAAEVEGEPHTPAKLYYTATPRSFLEKVPAFRDRRADIRGQQLGFLGVADETITTVVSIADQRDLKLDALACHRTQFEMDSETGRPKFFATSIPEPERSQLFGFERFVLAHSHLSPNGVEDDLFAGLGQL